ncbi:sulfur carrier protein ThiS [Phocaeicola sp.]|jgi:sulfur carrier protein|uniref:sulfur carrier protein ThiS n=1 Tax=Phocaeicola sp. TaxID=2773926 RepID=UPI003865A714
MKIIVNNKEVDLIQGNTIADLARQLELPLQGVAIALHNRMIPRAQWEEQMLQPGDSLVIIKAACGG